MSFICRAASTSGAPLTKSSSVGGEICSLGRNDDDDDDKKRRSSFGARMMGMVGLGKKSQSASQLNPEGQSQLIKSLHSQTNRELVVNRKGCSPRLTLGPVLLSQDGLFSTSYNTANI